MTHGTWPESRITRCSFCGESIIGVRRGDGELLHGRQNYWYVAEPAHDCDEVKAARKVIGESGGIANGLRRG